MADLQPILHPQSAVTTALTIKTNEVQQLDSQDSTARAEPNKSFYQPFLEPIRENKTGLIHLHKKHVLTCFNSSSRIHSAASSDKKNFPRGSLNPWESQDITNGYSTSSTIFSSPYWWEFHCWRIDSIIEEAMLRGSTHQPCRRARSRRAALLSPGCHPPRGFAPT